jgi:hypothetical protein
LSGRDIEYIRQFKAAFPHVDNPPSLKEYANPRRYDDLYMGVDLEKTLSTISNDNGGLAWGFSYRMMSLNEMFRATGDRKYLRENRRCIEKVLDVTDEMLGKELWTGRVVKAWGCDRYAERGRAVFAVHTGIILAPILEFLVLTESDDEFRRETEAGKILSDAQEALGVHDAQWRKGPGKGEGHYVGLEQEEVCEDRPLPGNRLSAMGWALLLSWRASGNEKHRENALAIGRYIKNRFTPSEDGAYYWPYWLPGEPVKGELSRDSIQGEDTSHASLTVELPIALGFEGVVFSREDMVRFARTVTNGFARLGGGILTSRITGQPDGPDPRHYIGSVTRWLALAEYVPELRDSIVDFYLNYRPVPSPLELSQLILFA